MAALLLALASASFSAVPSKETETKVPPVQLAQYGPVYHTENSLGEWFWGATPAAAMAACQANTAYGQYCYHRGFW